MITDQRLVSNYLSGSASAFEELYRRHRRRVLNMAAKYAEDQAHAEQIIELVFKRFHQWRHRLDSRHSLVHHLFVITRHEIIQYLKRNRRYKAEDWQDFDENTIANPAGTKDFAQEMQEQMADMNPETMKLLSIRFADGLAFAEIAEKLGIQ